MTRIQLQTTFALPNVYLISVHHINIFVLAVEKEKEYIQILQVFENEFIKAISALLKIVPKLLKIYMELNVSFKTTCHDGNFLL